MSWNLYLSCSLLEGPLRERERTLQQRFSTEVLRMDEEQEKKTRKTQQIKAAELRLDEESPSFGFVIAPDDLVALRAAQRESPLERSVRRIMETPDLQRKWLITPINGTIGSTKARATAKKWARTMTIDGTPVKLQTDAFKRRDGKGWGVMISYDPDRQPKPQPREDATGIAPSPEPPMPQPDIQQQQPSFDDGARF